MDVNRYQFDSIAAKTKQIVTPIQRGEEEGIYLDYLNRLEMCMYQLYENYHINGRQAKEILQLVLFDIKSAVERETYNCSKHEEHCYRECADIIGLFFLPQKNAELKAALKTPLQEDDDFFELARKNIIRIYESIELWTKESGPDGYFNFIGDFLGAEVGDEIFLVENRFLKNS